MVGLLVSQFAAPSGGRPEHADEDDDGDQDHEHGHV